ncbi:MAG: pentapeptide repeat-containing protein [Pseudomonadota bacterium]
MTEFGAEPERWLVITALGAFFLALVFAKQTGAFFRSFEAMVSEKRSHALAPVAIVLAVVIAVITARVLWLTFQGVVSELSDDPDVALRNYALILAAFIGAPFVVWRAIIAQRQADTAEQGLYAERYSKALALLATGSSTEQPTQADLIIKTGGIRALERLAQMSDADRLSILKLINDHVREHIGDVSADDDHNDYLRLRPDVRAGIEMLRTAVRDKTHEPLIGVFKPDLNGIRINRANLNGLDLSGFAIKGAVFEDCDLTSSKLRECKLTSTSFVKSKLYGAEFHGSQLDYVKLTNARIGTASFDDAVVQWMGTDHASLRGLDLRRARFGPTTRPGGEDPTVDRVDVKFFQNAFGDASVLLPPNIPWPRHWPPHRLRPAYYLARYREWRRAMGAEDNIEGPEWEGVERLNPIPGSQAVAPREIDERPR